MEDRIAKHLIELQAERQRRIDLALRNGYRPGFTRDGRVCLVEEEKAMLKTTLIRFGKKVTPQYVIDELKAVRFRIVEQTATHYPYEGDYYEATIEVRELLPGYKAVPMGEGHYIMRTEEAQKITDIEAWIKGPSEEAKGGDNR